MIENEYCTFHMENAYSVHSQHIMGKSKYACKTMYNTILQSCFISLMISVSVKFINVIKTWAKNLF